MKVLLTCGEGKEEEVVVGIRLEKHSNRVVLTRNDKPMITFDPETYEVGRETLRVNLKLRDEWTYRYQTF